MSIDTTTLFPLKAPSMSCRDIPNSTLGPCTPSPSASPIRPSAAPSNTWRQRARSNSSARSLLTSMRKCRANQTQSAPTGSKRTTVASPASSSPTPTASCAKCAIFNYPPATIPFALSTLGQEGDPIFQYDLFAASSYIRDSPTEPLPIWLIDAISGKSSSYHQALDLARSTDDWGLAAEVARYHETDTRILNIAAEIHALDCELQVVKATACQSRSRLEGARAPQRLRALQALDTCRPTRANAHAAGLRFARGRASFLDGE